ncbi:MAG: endonuclease domain-containing protein [Gallionellaceae bacterium]|jgi:very-short-patch-repair endonuclease
MRVRNSGKGKTPLDPPLSGGKLERSSEPASEEGSLTSPPLSRGGREGLAFTPYNNKLTALARENRKHPTAAESKLWYQLLRMKNLSSYKFTRQKPIIHFIADFYCAELRLVIEIDGDGHADAVVYDAERTKAMGSLGITVVRYTNDDILNNLQGVYVDLMRRIAMQKGVA